MGLVLVFPVQLAVRGARSDFGRDRLLLGGQRGLMVGAAFKGPRKMERSAQSEGKGNDAEDDPAFSLLLIIASVPPQDAWGQAFSYRTRMK